MRTNLGFGQDPDSPAASFAFQRETLRDEQTELYGRLVETWKSLHAPLRRSLEGTRQATTAADYRRSSGPVSR